TCSMSSPSSRSTRLVLSHMDTSAQRGPEGRRRPGCTRGPLYRTNRVIMSWTPVRMLAVLPYPHHVPQSCLLKGDLPDAVVPTPHRGQGMQNGPGPGAGRARAVVSVSRHVLGVCSPCLPCIAAARSSARHVCTGRLVGGSCLARNRRRGWRLRQLNGAEEGKC